MSFAECFEIAERAGMMETRGLAAGHGHGHSRGLVEPADPDGFVILHGLDAALRVHESRHYEVSHGYALDMTQLVMLENGTRLVSLLTRRLGSFFLFGRLTNGVIQGFPRAPTDAEPNAS